MNKFKAITQNEQGHKLPDPTLKDFGLGVRIAVGFEWDAVDEKHHPDGKTLDGYFEVDPEVIVMPTSKCEWYSYSYEDSDEVCASEIMYSYEGATSEEFLHSQLGYEIDSAFCLGDPLPILRPLGELPKLVYYDQVKLSEAFTKYDIEFIVKVGVCNEGILCRTETSNSITQYTKPWTIPQLRWLRDNNFCTADFRFASEIQHVKLNK